jgi:sterol desaturase/sphingolipid hydroxylase (fatty acid hydroxylase superfamily)
MNRLVTFARWSLGPGLVAASLVGFHFLRTAGGLADGLALFVVTVANLVGIALLELCLPRRREWSLLRDGQSPRDVAHALLATEGGGRIALAILDTGAALLAANLAGLNLSPQIWPAHWPFLAQFALGFILVEFLFYWQHRWFHKGLLWRFHALHHNPERMHVLKSGRLHIVEILIRHTIIYAPLILTGAPAEVFLWLAVWMNANGNLAHANLDLRFPDWFHYVVVTPPFHHLHHSRDMELGNTNFANSAPVLDWLFGTFRHPERHTLEETGIADDFYPCGFFGQLLAPWRRS